MIFFCQLLKGILKKGGNLKSLKIALFPTHLEMAISTLLPIIVRKPVLRTHAQLVLAIDYIFVCDYIQEICILSQMMVAFEIS